MHNTKYTPSSTKWNKKKTAGKWNRIIQNEIREACGSHT